MVFYVTTPTIWMVRAESRTGNDVPIASIYTEVESTDAILSKDLAAMTMTTTGSSSSIRSAYMQQELQRIINQIASSVPTTPTSTAATA
jgi:hypothetical protein